MISIWMSIIAFAENFPNLSFLHKEESRGRRDWLGLHIRITGRELMVHQISNL